MTLDLLRAHPDLVTELAPDHRRRCPERVSYPPQLLGIRGTSWPCTRAARWRVRGHPAECGQHAARSLRRELQADSEAAGGA